MTREHTGYDMPTRNKATIVHNDDSPNDPYRRLMLLSYDGNAKAWVNRNTNEIVHRCKPSEAENDLLALYSDPVWQLRLFQC